MVTNRSPLGLNVTAIASGSISSKVFSLLLQPTLELECAWQRTEIFFSIRDVPDNDGGRGSGSSP